MRGFLISRSLAGRACAESEHTEIQCVLAGEFAAGTGREPGSGRWIAWTTAGAHSGMATVLRRVQGFCVPVTREGWPGG